MFILKELNVEVDVLIFKSNGTTPDLRYSISWLQILRGHGVVRLCFLLTWELAYGIQNENCLPRTFLDWSWTEKSVGPRNNSQPKSSWAQL